MNRTFLFRFIGLSAVVMLLTTTAFAQTKQDASVQSTAGGTATSSSFEMTATVGQASPPGPASSAQFQLVGGFIAALGNNPPTVATVIPAQTLTIGGSAYTRDLNASPAIFADVDGDALMYSASSSNNAVATANVNGSMLTITPVAVGNATVTVNADDKNGGTVSTTIAVTVSMAINNPPRVANVIPNLELKTGESPFTRNLNAAPAIFNDPDRDPLVYTASSNAPTIAAASLSDSTLTVTAVAIGTATITVTANDNRGGTVSTSFMVTVTRGNRSPVVATTIMNQVIQLGGASFVRNLITAPAIFTDPDGDALTFTASSSAPAIATATISGSTLTVAPVAGGSATITVTANDGKGGTVSVMFTVKVNRAPTLANAIANQTLTAGASSFVRDLNASPKIFADPDDDALIYTAASSATNIATASISGSTLTVAPVAVGNATITVTADDQIGGKFSATFTVNVTTMINRAPTVATAIANQSLTVGGPVFSQDLNAAPKVFDDLDNDPLSYTAVSSSAAIATATIAGSTLTVMPVAAGNATIIVTANDNRGGSVNATFAASVSAAVNRAPVVTNAISAQRLANVGTTFTRDLTTVFSDPDNDMLSFTASTSAANIATATVPTNGNLLTVTAIAPGVATITLTASDGKPPAVPVSMTFMVTVNAAPNLVHTPAALQPNGQSLTILANVTDDGGLGPVVLNYRRAGDLAAFTASNMTTTGGGSYQANILANAVTSRGVEYFITATDVDNATTRIPAAPNSIYSVQVQVVSEAKPSPQPSGSVATAYRLISVPLQLDNISATTVLEDDLGPYDDTKWRLYGLAPGSSQDLGNKSPYVEFRSGGDLSPGKSLFLIVKDAGKTITASAARSVRTEQEFQITLQPGHNFIGTPFNFNIPASKQRLQSGGAVNLRTFAGSFSQASPIEMQPWEGYYFANLNQTSDILFVNPNLASAAQPVANKTLMNGWRLRILASCGEARDDYNFAGVDAASADGYDDNDLAEPPPIGDYVSLYFPHPEWQKALSRFSDDIRAGASVNHHWRFHVATNLVAEMVTLKFDALQEIDAELAVVLVDEELKFKQDLRENAVYQYQSRHVERAQEFSLLVGKKDFIAAQTAGVPGAPENFVLEQNFPNPFRVGGAYLLQSDANTMIRFGLPDKGVVTIKIFDLAGREVVTLLEKVELPPGRHQRLWNGRDAPGRFVPNGIYFYRLSAGNVVRTMKMMVIR